MSEILDERDLQIIKILMGNARTTMTEIAKRIGMTDVAVKKRIKRLEELGVIKKYTIVVDPAKIGYNSVALVGMDAEPESILEVANSLAQREYTKSVSLTTGDHMIMAEIWARDNSDLRKILEEIGKLKGVKKICPAIVLETIK